MKNRLYQDKNWLEKQYHIKGLSQKEIGKFCGVLYETIGRWIKKFEIKKSPKLYQNKDWLYKMYWIEKKSMFQIVKDSNSNYGSICYWMNKFGILRRSISESSHLANGNNVNLSQEARKWIDGELLGDGSLHSVNSYSAKFAYSSKYLEYIRYISSKLKSFGIKQCGNIYQRHQSKGYIIAGRPILRDIDAYAYQSLYYEELLPIYRKWYPKGKKIVPKDLELTPLICRQWYIGDGSLSHPEKRGKRPSIILSTNNFPVLDVEWLINELNKFGFMATRQIKSNIIHISSYSTKDFLNYIDSCPVDCYQYKWEYILK